MCDINVHSFITRLSAGLLTTGLFLVAFIFIMPCSAYACSYNAMYDTLYCADENGCNSSHLKDASCIIIDSKLSRDGIDKIKENDRLKHLRLASFEGLDEESIIRLYRPLAHGDIATAAVLFAYEQPYQGVGNDGTKLYISVTHEECPQIEYLRSCATVVSSAICAAGAADFGSAATDDLVVAFEASDKWQNMGRLKKDEMKPGDIVFIDRKSHAKEYESGAASDSEFEIEVDEEEEYSGGYDATGHKNYDTVEPTGGAYEVFCPDQDGDGEVGEWEAEYWKCYWERANKDTHEVPSYDYYYTWVREAEEYKEQKRIEQEKAEKERAKKKKKKVIHDHIFVWTGNEAICKYYPSSKGNIVSGSYTEKYSRARSAAVSKYNFTGDYRIYRFSD